MKDREKKAKKRLHDKEAKEEKKPRKADAGLSLSLSDEDEVTMSFVSGKLKDSCSD